MDINALKVDLIKKISALDDVNQLLAIQQILQATTTEKGQLPEFDQLFGKSSTPSDDGIDHLQNEIDDIFGS